LRNASNLTEDLVLLEQLKNGKENAWRQLFDRHYAAMCCLAASYLHDDFLAETVASAVIAHLWEIRDKVAIDRSLRSYLLQATRYRCLDYLKKEYVRKESSFSEMDEDRDIEVVSMPQEEPGAAALLESELEQEMGFAIEDLSESTRRIFKMSRMEGMQYEEIAKELGVSVNTVKYHIKKALAILRVRFGRSL